MPRCAPRSRRCSRRSGSTTADLKLRKMNVDEDGNRHFRYRQVSDGLDVIGGDLVVHVDVKGAIFGVNGAARGDLPVEAPEISGSDAVTRVASDARYDGFASRVTARGVPDHPREHASPRVRGDRPRHGAARIRRATRSTSTR